MSRICLITCYSGKLPNYFRLFAASCQRNPDIDFVVFNDQLKTDRRDGNVFLRKFSLDEFEQRVAGATGIKAHITRGYKLGDFKPLYGVLFRDLIRPYDFWGYCDLDVIFGNIRHFITPQLLAEFDIITSTEKWVSGHFTLLRNNDFCRHLFERSPSHQWILSDQDANWYFEESCKRWKGEFFSIDHLVSNNMPVSMYDVIRNLQNAGEIRACFGLPIREHTLRDRVNYLYRNGTLTDLQTKEEFMYHHLITIKYFWHFYIPNWRTIPAQYLIKDDGIQSLSEESGGRFLFWQIKRASYYAQGVGRSILKRTGATLKP